MLITSIASIEGATGEGGLGISEGQAQRIAIARSFLRLGKVILMDEPTKKFSLSDFIRTD